MSFPVIPCERCGEPLPLIEITCYGDPEPRFIPAGCPCPKPACPFCYRLIDHAGRCSNVDCFMWMTIIPIPEMVL